MGDGREQLSFDDAQILRLESDAIKGHTGKVAVLDAGIEVADLRARVAERIASVPRLGQRVDMSAAAPSWVEAPDLDLDWHVNDTRTWMEPLSDEQFRVLAGEVMGERLDHQRPLWRIDVVRLEGGRTGLVGRIHHAMADGVSAIRALSALLWDPRDDEEPRPQASAPSAGDRAAEPAPGPGREDEAGGMLAPLKRLPGAIWRELRPGADTALDRHIGPRRELAWRSVPLERLKRIEHGAGEGTGADRKVTINDVVLAVVTGALRRWLDSGKPPQRLRAQVPVCLHSHAEAAGAVGNRDSFLNVDLPIEESDPVARLRAINSETAERKLDHDAETLYSFFHALGRFGPLYHGVTRVTSGPREFALSVSNVPGPRYSPTLLGHPVAEFVSFAEPADRHALRVAVISLGGELAFGLCADPDAVSGLDRLANAFDASIDELEAAVSHMDGLTSD